MLIRTVRFSLTFGMALMALAACAPAGPQVVNVNLTSFEITVSSKSLSAGETSFAVKNEATDVMHELILVQTDLAPDALPLTAEGRVDEESTLFSEAGGAEDIAASTSAEFTATLEPGHYVYFCNIENHYTLGMRGEITVVP